MMKRSNNNTTAMLVDRSTHEDYRGAMASLILASTIFILWIVIIGQALESREAAAMLVDAGGSSILVPYVTGTAVNRIRTETFFKLCYTRNTVSSTAQSLESFTLIFIAAKFHPFFHLTAHPSPTQHHVEDS